MRDTERREIQTEDGSGMSVGGESSGVFTVGRRGRSQAMGMRHPGNKGEVPAWASIGAAGRRKPAKCQFQLVSHGQQPNTETGIKLSGKLGMLHTKPIPASPVSTDIVSSGGSVGMPTDPKVSGHPTDITHQFIPGSTTPGVQASRPASPRQLMEAEFHEQQARLRACRAEASARVANEAMAMAGRVPQRTVVAMDSIGTFFDESADPDEAASTAGMGTDGVGNEELEARGESSSEGALKQGNVVSIGIGNGTGLRVGATGDSRDSRSISGDGMDSPDLSPSSPPPSVMLFR